MSANFESATYPYERVHHSYLTFKGAEELPKKLLLYLLDLPDASGYMPQDNNARPRVRLSKYLWYDGARPLTNSLPTAEEKRSMLFDGEQPVVDSAEMKKKHPKGYRLYAQRFDGQAQTEAQTTIRCFLGRVFAENPYKARIGVTFIITCNVNQETTTRTDAYSRAYDIEQCIIEALHGVNMTGIGVCDFSRMAHGDNGSRSIYDQTGTLVGREVRMSIQWAESDDAEFGAVTAF